MVDAVVFLALRLGICGFEEFKCAVIACAVLDEPFVVCAGLRLYGSLGAFESVEIVERYGGDGEKGHVKNLTTDGRRCT